MIRCHHLVHVVASQQVYMLLLFCLKEMYCVMQPEDGVVLISSNHNL